MTDEEWERKKREFAREELGRELDERDKADADGEDADDGEESAMLEAIEGDARFEGVPEMLGDEVPTGEVSDGDVTCEFVPNGQKSKWDGDDDDEDEEGKGKPKPKSEGASGQT